MDSYEHFINLKIQKNNDNLQKSTHYQTNATSGRTINELITSICKYQKPYVEKSLYFLSGNSVKNTETLYRYIIVEQNEINIKESTKEGKIKILIDLAKFVCFKDFYKITKEDIFSYLNRYRKPEEIDPNHRWIGTWNNRHLVLLRFFRWSYNSNNPDIRNRKSPKCMNGIKRLRRKEVSRYKTADFWTQREYMIYHLV